VNVETIHWYHFADCDDDYSDDGDVGDDGDDVHYFYTSEMDDMKVQMRMGWLGNQK
jgi:hypothetical protein